jgi:glycosyltransferase 2 family protein
MFAIGLVSFLAYVMSPLLVIPLRNLRGRLGRLIRPVIPYLRRPVALIPAITLSLILQAALAACQYILARGLGLETPLATFMLLVPIANVAASLPITINGLGVREAAYLVLFAMAGVDKHDAIALSLLWFASTALGGLTGIVAFVTTEVPSNRSADSTPGRTRKSFASTETL